jgi:hypothetical protein
VKINQCTIIRVGSGENPTWHAFPVNISKFSIQNISSYITGTGFSPESAYKNLEKKMKELGENNDSN